MNKILTTIGIAVVFFLSLVNANAGSLTVYTAIEAEDLKRYAATFNEDLEFLEGQQACMASTLDQTFVDIKHDSARLPARRAIENMIKAEKGSVAAQ